MKRHEKQGREGKILPIKAEFQRIARKDKKAFFNEQCLITKENNKRGKIRDLFRKNGNIKGAFRPKMDTIKDKNGRDWVDTEEIKLRWKEYMEELYKTDLNEPDYYNDVVSHLECEVKWALRSTAVNKASGYDEIPAELFKSLKGCCHQGFAFIMSANLEDPAVATGLEKVNPHPNSQEG